MSSVVFEYLLEETFRIDIVRRAKAVHGGVTWQEPGVLGIVHSVDVDVLRVGLPSGNLQDKTGILGPDDHLTDADEVG